MKTVLISIKEKWWKKILSGEKELEIRKNRPKGIEYPFRVVCYVTGRGIMGAFTCDYIKKTNDYKELSECSGLEPGELFEYANGANGKTDTCLYGWHVQKGTPVEFGQAFKIDTAGVTRPPQRNRSKNWKTALKLSSRIGSRNIIFTRIFTRSRPRMSTLTTANSLSRKGTRNKSPGYNGRRRGVPGVYLRTGRGRVVQKRR